MKKYIVKVNGKEYEVEVSEIKQKNNDAAPAVKTVPQATVPIPQTTAASEPVNPGKGSGAVHSENSVIIKSPMPGTILKVSVAVGDSVKKGDVLLILEAMKMENEISAPADGMIAAIEVSKGASVNAGDLLVVIS